MSTRGPDAIGVDIGGTKVLAGLLVATGEPGPLASVARFVTPLRTDDLVEVVVAAVESFDVPDDVPVGVGCAGLVDRAGVVRSSPNLSDLRDLPLADELSEHLGRPVTVANDATCAAWGEHMVGAAVGVADVIVVTLGTGIGCGLVADGMPVIGTRGFAGEAGHMVVDSAGEPCICGNRGCWERYASGSGLGRLLSEALEAGDLPDVAAAAGGVEAVTHDHLDAAARNGSVGALAVYRDYANWLGLGLANLVNILDPELVVLGGGLIKAADLFMEPTRSSLVEHLYDARSRPVRLAVASLGEEATAVGAALLARAGGTAPA